jgi:hypothetical protein
VEFGIEYTPLRAYLKKLVELFLSRPLTPVPEYARRSEELRLAAGLPQI